MAHFDEVSTDPAVTREAVEAFVADPARIGERFAGKYLVATMAGTTGTRGIFVLDDRYWAVTSGLMAHLTEGWLSVREVVRLVTRGGRFAGVIATGGHFLSVTASTRELREVYGCTETGYAASSCPGGWLHLLDDWVILEPVDAQHRPVPPGVVSHTVLMTDLANRVQPIIRYDVGDRVLMRPGPCACGNPSPALHVEGRASDVLTFPTARGDGRVAVPPLAPEPPSP